MAVTRYLLLSCILTFWGSAFSRIISQIEDPTTGSGVFPPGKRDIACSICRNASVEITKVLLDPHTRLVATALVEEVACTNLPAEFLKECKGLVKKYVPEILSILANETTEENLCNKTKICVTQLYGPLSAMMEKASIKCDLCIEVATEFLLLLKSGKTQEEILSILHNACNRIKPAAVAEECVEYVDMYFPQLAAIIATVTPKEACRILKQCSANQTVSNVKSFVMAASALQAQAMAAMGTNSEECLACKLLVSQARKKLKNPVYQVELEDYLTSLCDKVPERSAECKDAVNQYLPEVFANIDKYVDPTKVCQDLKFCTARPWMQGYVETVGGALYA